MKKVVLLAMTAFLLLALSLAYAQTQDKGMFVSPTTGVPVTGVWGVFIGVSKYKQADLNLTYADKDATKLYEFFKGQFTGQVPADHFRLLTNEKATRRDVLKELAEVLNLAMEQHLVILSLSMHGLLDQSGQNLYFVTHDTNPNELWDRGLSQTDLMNMIARSKARKVVILLDACNSGGFGSSGTLLATKNVNTADVNRLLSAMGRSQDGIAVITSSSAAEHSQEGKKFCGGHGAFTCAVMEGLKGGADSNGNGLVEVRELYDFVYRTVKRNTGGVQNPNIDGRYDNGLPLAMTRASAPQGYRPEETKPVDTLSGGGPSDLAPIKVPESVGGSVNWALQDDWADTVAFEEGNASAGEKQKKWQAFTKKWKAEAEFAKKAADRTAQWGALVTALGRADKAWTEAKKRAGNKRIAVETRYNAVAEILNSAPSGWSHRGEAEALLEKLRQEKDKPAPEPVHVAQVEPPSNSTGNVWRDSQSGLTWQKTPPSNSMKWEAAKSYCSNLSLGGYSDWRLPSISELRSLIRGCSRNASGGACKVTDSCLSYSRCRNEACGGCSPSSGPGKGGCYMSSELEGECSWYWSSSPREGFGGGAWVVGFGFGYVLDGYVTTSGNVRCVR